MKNNLIGKSRGLISNVWQPFMAQVPSQFKGALVQKEVQWSGNTLKGVLALWTFWYTCQLFFSDLRKPPEHQLKYCMIRLSVIFVSILFQFQLHRKNIKRSELSLISTVSALVYLGSYVSFSYLPLPIRTIWVTILPTGFILATPRSGRNAILSYAILVVSGLLAFHQSYNPIWLVSDIIFGLVLVCCGIMIKTLWVKSVVLTLAQEESKRVSLQNEIQILNAVETFIPKGIRSIIREGVSKGIPISEVIQSMTHPKKQKVSILYSDYRNYSSRSSNLEFVKNELIGSSEKIVEFAENHNANVQNRGDSILAVFSEEIGDHPHLSALHTGLMSSIEEHKRVTSKNKNSPDRYMIITSGEVVFCSLGNETRQEMTIAGKPANLAARLDELTKQPVLKMLLDQSPCVLVDHETKTKISKNGFPFEFEEINLASLQLEVRTYPEEQKIFLLRSNPDVIEFLQELTMNQYRIGSKAA